MCSYTLSYPGAHSHVGLSGTRACSRRHGLQKTKLSREAHTPETGFVLALLRTWLDFFYGDMDRAETQGQPTLETQGQISSRINHPTTPQSPTHGSLECFPRDPMEQPDSQRQKRDLGLHLGPAAVLTLSPASSPLRGSFSHRQTGGKKGVAFVSTR